MKEKSILSVDYKMISDVKMVISAHKRVKRHVFYPRSANTMKNQATKK